MTEPRRLRALIVEDEEQDVPLLVRELRRAGYEVSHERVDTALALRDALARGTWDIVLSDFAMPRFDGREALEIVRASGLDLPFVMVTGFIGEEQAAALMKAGASDFLVKDRLFRLGAVVEREVMEAQARREQARALAAKQLELLQSQKMEAVGRLAGGVAHDFNNLLSVILGFAHMLERRLPYEDRLRRPTDEIVRAAERAAGLTRQLLRFSRKEVPAPRVLDLNRVVRGAVAMLERVIGENVELRTRLLDGLAPVRADAGQLEQVIVNLAVNAKDAMPEGGRLLLETAPVPSATRPGVRLTVRDTGCGIVPEVRARLFEPFFTTKEVGKGTGLGLATVLGIVTEAGGRVEVESEPLRGSSFHIFLPGADEPPSPPLARAVLSEADRHGTETVLLVEDDDSVRSLLRDVLADAGYAVLASGSVREAAALATPHPGEIHLLLCDVVLPGGSGHALHRTLLERRPHLPVLYLSGYTDDELRRAGLPEGAPLVRKPLAGDELLLAVRSLLDALA